MTASSRAARPLLWLAALCLATPASAATPEPASTSLGDQIQVAVREAETMATSSGQPARFVVFEITKAVRDVVWSSGEPPSAIVKSLDALDMSQFTPQARTAVMMIEQEMKD